MSTNLQDTSFTFLLRMRLRSHDTIEFAGKKIWGVCLSCFAMWLDNVRSTSSRWGMCTVWFSKHENYYNFIVGRVLNVLLRTTTISTYLTSLISLDKFNITRQTRGLLRQVGELIQVKHNLKVKYEASVMQLNIKRVFDLVGEKLLVSVVITCVIIVLQSWSWQNAWSPYNVQARGGLERRISAWMRPIILAKQLVRWRDNEWACIWNAELGRWGSKGGGVQCWTNFGWLRLFSSWWRRSRCFIIVEKVNCIEWKSNLYSSCEQVWACKLTVGKRRGRCLCQIANFGWIDVQGSGSRDDIWEWEHGAIHCALWKNWCSKGVEITQRGRRCCGEGVLWRMQHAESRTGVECRVVSLCRRVVEERRALRSWSSQVAIKASREIERCSNCCRARSLCGLDEPVSWVEVMLEWTTVWEWFLNKNGFWGEICGFNKLYYVSISRVHCDCECICENWIFTLMQKKNWY